MTLLDGEILWHLVWILPLAGLIWYCGCRKRKALLQKFLGEQADDPARVNASPVLRFWRAVLFAGTVILLLAGILCFVLMTYLSYKKACSDFDKVDL